MEMSGDDPNAADESEGSVLSNESASSTRQGRFTGAQSTWRQLTHDERLVSTSLIRLRDQDLSIHLYNAHAMKRRLYIPDVFSKKKLDPWAQKGRWWAEEANETHEESEDFVPPKTWTAWPMPVDVVPRSDEQIGPIDEDDVYTFKKRVLARPSRELEDALTGTILRIAKERFGEREWDSPRLDTVKDSAKRSDRVMKFSGGPDASSSDRPVTYQRQDLHLVPATGVLSQSIEQGMPFGQLEHAVLLDESGVEDVTFVKEVPGELPEKSLAFQHPVVSTDDERSRVLLRPTIRHILAKLDELLLGLHYARQTCVHYSSDHTDSQTEADNDESSDESDGDSPTRPEQPQPPRKLGRPSKVLDVPMGGESSSLDSSEVPKMTKRGRPRIVHIPLKDETHNEMLVRVARVNKQKLPFQSASNSRASSRHSKSGGQRRRQSLNRGLQPKRMGRLGLRDWSEVMGTAAFVGFSPDAVSRATQRCASLFGEGMAMHHLLQNPPTEWEKDETVLYAPERIPYLGGETPGESEAEIAVNARDTPQPRRRGVRSKSVKADKDESVNEEKDVPDIEDNFWCSYHDCPRHDQGFSKKWNLISHLMNAHRLAGDELDKALEDSDDEILGGVHVDRFMKDIKSRRGWRGHDSVKRTRSKSLAPKENVSDPE